MRYVRCYAAVLLFLLLFLVRDAVAERLYLVGKTEDLGGFVQAFQGEQGDRVCVLWRVTDKEKKQAIAYLGENGFAKEDIVFLGCAPVQGKNLTPENLDRLWATKTQTASLASRVRRLEPEEIVYYTRTPEIRAFLSRFTETVAYAAADPEVRRAEMKEDEYLYETPGLLDGITGERRLLTYPSLQEHFVSIYGDPDLPEIPDTPARDSEGYLLEGKYVYSDAEGGLCAYLSPALQIVIVRREAPSLRWYEADIRRKPEGDSLHVVASESGRDIPPEQLAQESRMVLGINGDYYRYRLNYGRQSGLIVRKGEVLFDTKGKTTGTLLPPLDTLSLNASGMFRLDTAGELDGKQALDIGAEDVLSFGPILVRDGRMRMLRQKNRMNREPRTAIGEIEENHYLAVVVEGRLKESKGISLDDLAGLMLSRGCREAFNLDGGHTSTLVFMGRRLNSIGDLQGNGTTKPRAMRELLGIGESAEVKNDE